MPHRLKGLVYSWRGGLMSGGGSCPPRAGVLGPMKPQPLQNLRVGGRRTSGKRSPVFLCRSRTRSLRLWRTAPRCAVFLAAGPRAADVLAFCSLVPWSGEGRARDGLRAGKAVTGHVGHQRTVPRLGTGEARVPDPARPPAVLVSLPVCSLAVTGKKIYLNP